MLSPWTTHLPRLPEGQLSRGTVVCLLGGNEFVIWAQNGLHLSLMPIRRTAQRGYVAIPDELGVIRHWIDTIDRHHMTPAGFKVVGMLSGQQVIEVEAELWRQRRALRIEKPRAHALSGVFG